MIKVVRHLAGSLALFAALTVMPGVAAASYTIDAPVGAERNANTLPAKVEAEAETTAPVAEAQAETPQADQAESAGRIVQVQTRVVVRNVLADAAKNLNIVVPPTVTNRAGTQRVLDVTFVTEPSATRQTDAGVEASYQVAEVPGFASLTFEQIYTVELLGNAQSVIEESVDARFLEAENGIESDDPAIRSKALEVTKGLTTTEQKAEAIIRFVVGHITYDATAASRNKGALAGFETRIGVCQEYANLFVAMARANGIPARLVYGWANSVRLDGSLNAENRHVWAEYYDAQKGWVAVDPTFAEVQEDVLAFDSQNHLAQDWSNSNFSASFGGRGLLSVVAQQTLTQLTTAQR